MSRNLQLVSMQRILAGLIHNINTPLNLILGYSQQIQITQGDSPYLQKIMDAGIRIDDLLSGILDTIHERTYSEIKEVDVLKWLAAEIAFLQNELSIKRKIIFKVQESDGQMLVRNSSPLLSTDFEAFVLNYRDILGGQSGSISIQPSFDGESVTLMMVCSVPEQESDMPVWGELIPDPALMKEELNGFDAGKYYACGAYEVTLEKKEILIPFRIMNVYE